jgi:elongation factor Ts
MAEITAASVKELRDRTGAGMMDAKKALVAAGGDVETAIKQLREAGAIKAEKKAGRETNEGRVAGFVSGHSAALAAVCSETDFVAKNTQFGDFAAMVAKTLAGAEGMTDPAAVAAGGGKTLGDLLKEQVLSIGENLQFGKCVRLSAPGTFFGLYVHNNSKLGVLTQIKGAATPAGEAMAKEIAMHAAFSNPLALDRSGVSAETVAAEKDIYKKQAEQEGKPAAMLDKIADGKLNAFYRDRVLSEQLFVKDPKKTITQVVKEAGAFELVGFAYVAIG